jgi:hypothetical protein
MRLIEDAVIGGGRGCRKVKRLLTSGGFDRRLEFHLGYLYTSYHYTHHLIVDTYIL